MAGSELIDRKTGPSDQKIKERPRVPTSSPNQISCLFILSIVSIYAHLVHYQDLRGFGPQADCRAPKRGFGRPDAASSTPATRRSRISARQSVPQSIDRKEILERETLWRLPHPRTVELTAVNPAVLVKRADRSRLSAKP